MEGVKELHLLFLEDEQIHGQRRAAIHCPRGQFIPQQIDGVVDTGPGPGWTRNRNVHRAAGAGRLAAGGQDLEDRRICFASDLDGLRPWPDLIRHPIPTCARPDAYVVSFVAVVRIVLAGRRAVFGGVPQQRRIDRAAADGRAGCFADQITGFIDLQIACAQATQAAQSCLCQ